MVKKRVIYASKAAKPVGAYSHGVIYNGVLYTAGQIALDPATNELVSGGAKEQARQVMLNLQAILEEVGTNYDNLLNAKIYISDLNDFKDVDEVYQEFVKVDFPGRICIECKIPKGSKVMVELIAAV
jgi:2-iminobutanoate/2-iminopropanoate deaminase